MVIIMSVFRSLGGPIRLGAPAPQGAHLRPWLAVGGGMCDSLTWVAKLQISEFLSLNHSNAKMSDIRPQILNLKS